MYFGEEQDKIRRKTEVNFVSFRKTECRSKFLMLLTICLDNRVFKPLYERPKHGAEEEVFPRE